MQVYKDDNHKPEMALAITDFEALNSFAPHEDLAAALSEVPELRSVVGPETASHYIASTLKNRKAALQTAFTSLMTADAATVATAIQQLTARLAQEATTRSLTAKESLILRLQEQYPDDVGILSVYFLNFVTLKAGEAIFLAANEPHAYVSGQLMEVMATSDNVVRAGLTPKLRDTQVLCSSLTYLQGSPSVLHGTQVTPCVKTYQPPFDEFQLSALTIPAGEAASLLESPSPLILVLTAGSAQATASAPMSDAALQTEGEVRRGDIYFIPAGAAVTFSAGSEGLAGYFAGVNSQVYA